MNYWTMIGILISWLTFWFIGFAFFGLLAWLGILGYLLYKKSFAWSYLLLSAWLCVPSCSFVRGAVNYLGGSASKMELGSQWGPPGIDPDTRIPTKGSGCVLLGFEFFVFPANNIAIRLMTQIFGYQKGSYLGPIPDDSTVLNWLESGDTTIAVLVEDQFQIKLDGQSYFIQTDQFYYTSLQYDYLNTLVAKALPQGGLLIKPIQAERREEQGAFLFDTQNGALLKIYFLD